MYCSQCGAKLPDNAKFCYKCGAKIEIPDWEDGQQNAAEEVPQQPAIQWPEFPSPVQPVQPVQKREEPQFRWPEMPNVRQTVTEQPPVPAAEPAVTEQAPVPEPAVQTAEEPAPVSYVQEYVPEISQPAAEEPAAAVDEPAGTGYFRAEEEPAAPAPAEEPVIEYPEETQTQTEAELPAEEYAPFRPEPAVYTEEVPSVQYEEEIPEEELVETLPEEEPVLEETAEENEFPQENVPQEEPVFTAFEPVPYQEEVQYPAEEEPAEETVPEETAVSEEQPEDDLQGFRIVERTAPAAAGAYLFSHANDLEKAASDALSQFSILTEQEIRNVEDSVAIAEEETVQEHTEETAEPAYTETAEKPEYTAQSEEQVYTEPETETESYDNEPEVSGYTGSETGSGFTVPEEAPVYTGPETEPEVPEYTETDTYDTEPEEVPVYEEPETEPVSTVTEVPEYTVPEEPEYTEPAVEEEYTEPAAEPEYTEQEKTYSGPVEEFAFAGPQEGTWTPERPYADISAEEEEEEAPAAESGIEDFIPSRLLQEENAAEETQTEETAADTEENIRPVQTEIPVTGTEGNTPISFEEFGFYGRRTMEPQRTADEQLSGDAAVQEEPAEEHPGFSFEGIREPVQEESIPELMYAPEELQQTAEEPVQTEETPDEPAEGPAEKTVFRHGEETSEDEPEAAPEEEKQPEEEKPAETDTAAEKPISRSSKKESRRSGKRTSGRRSSSSDSEEDDKKTENRNRLIAVILALAVLAAAAFGGWYWYNLPDNVYSRYMSGALKAVEGGDVYTAALDFNKALEIRPESLQASEQLDRLYSETFDSAYDYMYKQMFSEAHDQARLLSTIHPDELERNTAALKEVFVAWAAASARSGNDSDIQHILDLAASELSAENYADVEESARAAKTGYEFADFFMENGDKLLELNSGHNTVAVFAQLDQMLPRILEYAQRDGSFPVRTGTDEQGREAAIFYDGESMLQLYIGRFNDAGRRTGEAISYIITTGSGGTKEYGHHTAEWSDGSPYGSFRYRDLASDYNAAERRITSGIVVNGYFDGNIPMIASDGYTYNTSFVQGTVRVVDETAPDGQRNVIGYTSDEERWICVSDEDLSRKHGIPYVEG